MRLEKLPSLSLRLLNAISVRSPCLIKRIVCRNLHNLILQLILIPFSVVGARVSDKVTIDAKKILMILFVIFAFLSVLRSCIYSYETN